MDGFVRVMKSRGALLAICYVLAPGLMIGPADAAQAAPSVAVLPFANVSGDASEDYLADGLADEIHTALTRIPALTAMGRGSSLRFKGRDADVRAIGQALGSDYIVKGTTRKAGDRIRVSAQLLRAQDGMELWSENYYTPFEEIFDIEEDAVRKIAGALQVPVPASELARRSANLEAYDKFLHARPLMRARGARAFADAAVLLEEAVASDPKFAPAAAALSFDYGLTPLLAQALRAETVAAARAIVSRAVPRGEMLGMRAIELDPKSADGYVGLAYAKMVQFKTIEAEDAFKQALALDPNHPDGLHGYSQLVAALGRIDESLALRRHLQDVERLVPNYTADTAEIIWLGGDADTAIRMLNEFRPGRTAELAQIEASLGRYSEAASHLREMNPMGLPGAVESAARTLEAAPAPADSPASLPRLENLGFAYLHRGATERVMEYYEFEVQAGYFQPISTTWFWHPSYAAVRKLDRFKTYLRNAGIVEYWRARGWPALCHPLGADDFACD